MSEGLIRAKAAAMVLAGGKWAGMSHTARLWAIKEELEKAQAAR